MLQPRKTLPLLSIGLRSQGNAIGDHCSRQLCQNSAGAAADMWTSDHWFEKAHRPSSRAQERAAISCVAHWLFLRYCTSSHCRRSLGCFHNGPLPPLLTSPAATASSPVTLGPEWSCLSAPPLAAAPPPMRQSAAADGFRSLRLPPPLVTSSAEAAFPLGPERGCRWTQPTAAVLHSGMQSLSMLCHGRCRRCRCRYPLLLPGLQAASRKGLPMSSTARSRPSTEAAISPCCDLLQAPMPSLLPLAAVICRQVLRPGPGRGCPLDPAPAAALDRAANSSR